MDANLLSFTLQYNEMHKLKSTTLVSMVMIELSF